jgi:DNA-binding PadR family transcriptional regulator
MRHSHGVRFAVLGVVSRHPDGIHGYRLKQQCDRSLGDFWRLNFGEVYRILDQLVSENLIEQIASRKASQKLYRITAKGERSLDDFLLTPPTDEPRPMRQELAVKILFAERGRLPDLLKLIEHQRDTYLKQLYRLGLQRGRLRRVPSGTFLTELLLDGAELAVRAELAWLDDVTRKLVMHFKAPSA